MSLISDTLRNSSAPALYDAHRGRRWTYRELSGTVQQTAGLLAGKKKALFFLFCRNDVASVVAYLAAVEAGHAVALLDENLAPEFKQRLIDLYQPEFVLSSVPTATLGIDEMEKTYSQTAIGNPALYVWSSDAERIDTINPALALLLTTSGSTGALKFVRLTTSNIESNARAIAAGLELTERDKPITSLPMHSSFGLTVINSHLLAGAEIVVTDWGVTTPEFWSVFREQQCTSWAGVPYGYQRLESLDWVRLNVPSLRKLMLAGGKLEPQVAAAHFHRLMTERGGQFFALYGQAEATGLMSILPSQMLPEKLGSCGRAVSGGALAIASEVGLTNEPGITGEVFYRGPNVMLGYATRREDLGLGDERNGTLATGDVGYLDSEGYLFLTERRRRDATVAGVRVNTDEVGEALRSYGPTMAVVEDDVLMVYCEHGDERAFEQYAQELSSRFGIPVEALEFRRVLQLPVWRRSDEG